MILEAVYHRPKNAYAYAYDRETLHIRIQTKKQDVERIELLCGDKYDWSGTVQSVPMRRYAWNERHDFWQAEVIPPYHRLRYAFGLTSGEKQVWYTERGFKMEKPVNADGLFEFPYLNRVDVFEPPAWVKEAVFYQIFPERFANGDLTNDPAGVLPWEDGVPAPGNFFGGDLQGVMDHLDHLEALGVNAIYFTPVFKATTNHKYDTIDYMQVDPHFGDNEKLKELVELCHGRGIRVLLDAVFNHSGYWFPPFQDVLEKGKDSKYIDWFYVRDYPIVTEPRPNYDTFAFEWRMPKLNTENPEVKKYLLDVAEYWIKEVGIDGWRLDVANEVDHAFWREFRQTVKRINADAYILGEIWHDSMPWLQGDQFDAVMNYPVTDAVLDFVAKQSIDAEAFANQIHTVLAGYPQQVNEVAFNLLDSHDTPRLLTLVDGDKRKLQLAVLFQLTFLGTPCIYYGDEVGMTGGADPGCRKPMEWREAKQDRELLGFYQSLIELRKKHRALRDGSFRFLKAEGDVAVIERAYGGEAFVIAFNRGVQPVEVEVPRPAGAGQWAARHGKGGAQPGEGGAQYTASNSVILELPSFGWTILQST